MSATETITVTPTPTWTPLRIQGVIPEPFYTPKFGLKVIPIHPTFGCELEGVDWSKDIPEDVYKEIRVLVDKVSFLVKAFIYMRLMLGWC